MDKTRGYAVEVAHPLVMDIEVWGPRHKSAVKNAKIRKNLSTADAADIDLRI